LHIASTIKTVTLKEVIHSLKRARRKVSLNELLTYD